MILTYTRAVWHANRTDAPNASGTWLHVKAVDVSEVDRLDGCVGENNRSVG